MGLGVTVMLMLAAGLYFGSRIPPKVDAHANLTFVEVWMAIISLIIVMLGLERCSTGSLHVFTPAESNVPWHRNDKGSFGNAMKRSSIVLPSPNRFRIEDFSHPIIDDLAAGGRFQICHAN